MRDTPGRRPAASPPPASRPLLAAALRCAAVAALVGAVAAVAAPSGFWACVPGALLLVAAAGSPAESVAGVLLPVAAASLATGGTPSPLVGLAVAASSASVLHGVRALHVRERDALRRSALRDSLTGLSNRRGLDERIGYEIARHGRERRRFAVVAIDLDGFKLVNDRFGHGAGDDVLRDVADALSAEVREQDTVARLGGDEFSPPRPTAAAEPTWPQRSSGRSPASPPGSTP
jgi:hypothetical protein